MIIGTPWTEDEHRTFLIGLERLGKGDWRGISRNYVTTRTPTQVASHAQKYFLRLASLNKKKRRSSLFDMVRCIPIKSPRSVPMLLIKGSDWFLYMQVRSSSQANGDHVPSHQYEIQNDTILPLTLANNQENDEYPQLVSDNNSLLPLPKPSNRSKKTSSDDDLELTLACPISVEGSKASTSPFFVSIRAT